MDRERLFNLKPIEAQIEEIAELVKSGSTPAQYIWERIKKLVSRFEEQLDDSHEILLTIKSTFTAKTERVKSISYWSPDLLIYECGSGTVLIQHYSQLNFQINSIKKKNPKRPARRIGFNIHSDDTDCQN